MTPQDGSCVLSALYSAQIWRQAKTAQFFKNSNNTPRTYMTDTATQSASPPVKDYHGSGKIPIGRRFGSIPSGVFLWACTNGGTFLCVEGTLFAQCERRSPFAEKSSAPHVTRHGDIPFCMSNQSRRAQARNLASKNMRLTQGNFFRNSW